MYLSIWELLGDCSHNELMRPYYCISGIHPLTVHLKNELSICTFPGSVRVYTCYTNRGSSTQEDYWEMNLEVCLNPVSWSELNEVRDRRNDCELFFCSSKHHSLCFLFVGGATFRSNAASLCCRVLTHRGESRANEMFSAFCVSSGVIREKNLQWAPASSSCVWA